MTATIIQNENGTRLEVEAPSGAYFSIPLHQEQYVSIIEQLNSQLKRIPMELRVDKDKVVQAASQCPDAKQVLQTLFPEAFERDYSKEMPQLGAQSVLTGKHGLLDRPALFFTPEAKERFRLENEMLVGVSMFHADALILGSNFDWTIEQRSQNLYLIPKRKNK